MNVDLDALGAQARAATHDGAVVIMVIDPRDVLALIARIRQLEQSNANPPWLADAAEALQGKNPDGSTPALNWTQVIVGIRKLRQISDAADIVTQLLDRQREQIDALTQANATKATRIADLLAAVLADQALSAALVAEVGTLKARVAELERESSRERQVSGGVVAAAIAWRDHFDDEPPDDGCDDQLESALIGAVDAARKAWRDCTCLGSCKGVDGLAPGWRCALGRTAAP